MGTEDRAGQGSYRSVDKCGLYNLWNVERKGVEKWGKSPGDQSSAGGGLGETEWGGRGQGEMLMVEILHITTLLETMRSRTWA